ncbi:TonB-dependent receptor [Sphingomonas agri]|uniref:TonB-dependent receptor n=1 Tax=Sphingomonas agri TaxID=1813878 RepID=UPI00311F6441
MLAATSSLSFVATAAHAQDATNAPGAATAPDQSQNIVITGLRASLKKALDIKLTADHIQDTLVAEDIGKLPDQNIAEAIERIPGIVVSTNTVNGSGQSAGEPTEISVRGFSPEFASALYNGRVLATDSGGREFDFDVLPAELIARVDVSKSATADQPEGGIAATVNMMTFRPLDLKRNTFTASVQGNYDQQRRNVTPQASALFSTKTADGRFGFLAAASYINRKVENKRIFSACLNSPSNVTVGGRTVSGFVPCYTEWEVNPTSRERKSAVLVAQFRPSDQLLFTIDGLYSKFNINDNTQGFFTGNNNPSGTVTVASDSTVTSYTGGTGYSGIVNYVRPELSETKELGFNARFNPTPRLSMVFDASWSKATNDNGGNQSWSESDYGALPNATFNLGPNNLPVMSNLGNLQPSPSLLTGFHTYEGQDFIDKIYQFDGRLRYEVGSGILKDIQAGLNYSHRSKTQLTVKTPVINGVDLTSVGDGIVLPASLYTPVRGINNLFGTGMFTSGLPGFSDAAFDAYLLSPAVVATYTPAQQAALAANGGGFAARLIPSSSGEVKEKTTGGFIEAAFGGDHGWSGNIGLRATKTSTISTGSFAQPILVPGNANQLAFGPPSPIEQRGHYFRLLPNANLKVDLTPNLMAQLAVAETLTRPTLSALLIEASYSIQRPPFSISQGNPNLKPMSAWNYDAALTWHRGSDFLSLALYKKFVTNLLGNGISSITFLGQPFTVFQPININSEHYTGFEVSGQYTFGMLPAPFDGLGVQANYSYTHPSRAFKNAITYNLIGFYEKGPLQLRAAYNWRNAQVLSGNVVTVNGQSVHNDEFQASYGQLDASIQYTVTKNLAVFAQALNLTDRKSIKYWGVPDRIEDYEGYGRRFGVGARVKF